jgi:phage terminase large subunit-like protein
VLVRSEALALPYSADAAEALRGPQHHYAWCDELAKWRHGDATWDNLMLGLRAGERPQVLVTTTPRAVPLLRRIRGLDGFVETRGTTGENVHLAPDFLADMEAAYGGSRLGRQELGGELIEDVAGSLWPRAVIEACRCDRPDPNPSPEREEFFRRIVVGVDPPATAAGTCGISVCGLGADGVIYVLADLSAAGLSPDGWARAVRAAAAAWGADRVIAEANQGGDMVRSVLKAAGAGLPVKLVRASRGKAARAEPVATLFENGEAKFAGCFPALEDELAGLTAGGDYAGPGPSPDRADAMVWALADLLLGTERRPSVRGL